MDWLTGQVQPTMSESLACCCIQDWIFSVYIVYMIIHLEHGQIAIMGCCAPLIALSSTRCMLLFIYFTHKGAATRPGVILHT